MKEIRIECPSCQQPIQFAVPAPRLWFFVSLILAIVCAALACTMYMHRPNWKSELPVCTATVEAMREQTLRSLEHDLMMLDSDNFAALQKYINSYSNSLSVFIDQPVILKGKVFGHGAETAIVDSGSGAPDSLNSWWPVLQGGKLYQGGFFVIRNAKKLNIQLAARISGTGIKPYALIHTNDVGVRNMEMSYEFVPEK